MSEDIQRAFRGPAAVHEAPTELAGTLSPPAAERRAASEEDEQVELSRSLCRSARNVKQPCRTPTALEDFKNPCRTPTGFQEFVPDTDGAGGFQKPVPDTDGCSRIRVDPGCSVCSFLEGVFADEEILNTYRKCRC